LLNQPKALPELTNFIENGRAVRKNETKKSRLAFLYPQLFKSPKIGRGISYGATRSL